MKRETQHIYSRSAVWAVRDPTSRSLQQPQKKTNSGREATIRGRTAEEGEGGRGLLGEGEMLLDHERARVIKEGLEHSKEGEGHAPFINPLLHRILTEHAQQSTAVGGRAARAEVKIGPMIGK